MYLKAYERSHNEFRELYNKHVPPKEAEIICRKLIRHFKVGQYVDRVVFCKREGYGHASYGERLIALPKQNIALGIIAHEVGHFLVYKKYIKTCGLKRAHCRKAYVQINKVYRYSYRFLSNNIDIGVIEPSHVTIGGKCEILERVPTVKDCKKCACPSNKYNQKFWKE